jgi:hypothetical protein
VTSTLTPATRPSPFRAMHLGGNVWGITSPYYSPLIHRTLKPVPGLQWDGARKVWWGYVDAVDAGARRLLAAKVRVDTSEIPEPGKQVGVVTVMPVALKDLREYQKEGAIFLVAHAHEGAFLADDLGLGKTVQSIRAARALRGKTVFVCPAFLRDVWVTGLKGDKTLTPPTPAGWPGVKFEVLRTRKAKPIAADVQAIIINPDILGAWLDEILKWGPETVSVDEAHMYMGDTSKRTRALVKLMEKTANRWLLSGTPMTVRPRDLWAPVNALSPDRFGRPFPFYLAYCCPPEAPVWMGDTSFKPIGDVRVGDEVIGWDDGGKGRYRKLVRAKVTAIHKRIAPIVKVTLASGRVLRCTPDHQWLNGRHCSKQSRWTHPLIGRDLTHVIDMPRALTAHEQRTAAWLGGLFDGEGNVSVRPNSRTLSILQSPTHNHVCAAIEAALTDLGLKYATYQVQRGNPCVRYMLNGRQQFVNFLAWCSPVRRAKIEQCILSARFKTPDRIVSVVPDGEGEVVSMTTTTGNYIAWGYASKNCNAFQKRISAEKTVWDTKGASNLPELNRRLQFFMLRRTKADVKMQLPPHTRQMIEVDIDKRFVISIAAALKSDDNLHRALSMAADGKIGDAASLVLSHARAGKKIIVGCWRKIIAETIAGALISEKIDARVIHSEVSATRRREILAAKPQVVCMTLDMAVGLDLTFANIGVCVELHPVPSKLVQWEGRYYRFRQTLPVQTQYIIARGTADELVRAGVLSKLHVFEQTVGKLDGQLKEDLESLEKAPAEQLKTLYERMKAKQSAQPDTEEPEE